MRDLIKDASSTEADGGEEQELEELADLARQLLSQREIKVEEEDGSTSIVDRLTLMNASTDESYNQRLPAFSMRGTSRQVIEAKRRLGMMPTNSGVLSQARFRMQDYMYGNRCGIWSIKLPGLKGEKINDVRVKVENVEESGPIVGYQAKNINIKIVRRKKMNKHKWKKLRRKYRNSTRHSRSKRKRNREELMKEYAYLGMWIMKLTVTRVGVWKKIGE
jgi:hypothetical protein